MNLVLLAAMGAVVVGFVLHPIFSREEVSPEHPDETRREMGRLEDEKNRLLATIKDLELMRRTVSEKVQVKAAGGVRDLDMALKVKEIGCTRFGATQTESIMEACIAKYG